MVAAEHVVVVEEPVAVDLYFAVQVEAVVGIVAGLAPVLLVTEAEQGLVLHIVVDCYIQAAVLVGGVAEVKMVATVAGVGPVVAGAEIADHKVAASMPVVVLEVAELQGAVVELGQAVGHVGFVVLR